MPSLPLASPARQRRLHLGDTGDTHAADLRDNLSGLAGRDSWLWLAGDEGRSLHRLQGDDERGYGDPIRVKLAAASPAAASAWPSITTAGKMPSPPPWQQTT